MAPTPQACGRATLPPPLCARLAALLAAVLAGAGAHAPAHAHADLFQVSPPRRHEAA
jgi:hypothetical protein